MIQILLKLLRQTGAENPGLGSIVKISKSEMTCQLASEAVMWISYLC